MSRNFLGIAISTTSISQGYVGCSNNDSPLTPRRTLRTPRSATFSPLSPFRDFDSGRLRSPRTVPSSPKPLSRLFNARQERQRPHPPSIEIKESSELSSPTESTNFLPFSPALATPSLLWEDCTRRPKLGTFSAINIILGKTIGVGIYSVPSSIYSDVGSVGASLLVWALGAAISFCGLAVYLDLGTALPKSGGEKVYLERIYRRPKFLAACILMSYVVLLGFSTPNCIVLGEYLIYALGMEVNRWNVRAIAVGAISMACVIHARLPGLGLRLINVLGVIKMVIIATIIVSGLASIPLGIGQIPGAEGLPASTTFSRNFTSLFAGTTSQPYALASALLKSLYCYRGYNTANQVLSEVHRPVRTLSVAAPVALATVSVAYLFVNIAYFCTVDKDSFASSGLVVAGHFFTNIFGEIVGARILPLLIILSAFGSIAATSFAQARVNQEFARENLLPCSSFWAVKSSWGTPAAALGLHWIVSVAVIVLPPPGQIYTFLVELGGYPVSVVSVFVGGGLLYLQLTPSEKWVSPKPANKVATILFLFSNIVLLVLPWIPPENGRGGRGVFPYYAYPAGGIGVLILGAVYWVWLSRLRNLWHVVEDRIIGSAVAGEEMAMKDWKRDVVKREKR